MAPQNVAGHPSHPTPPEGFMEFLTVMLQNGAFQNGTFPPFPTTQSPSPSPSAASPTPLSPSHPPPSTQPRVFDRAGRGTGGALANKQKVSKEITASASKRKALDSDAEAQLELTPEAGQSAGTKQAKRPKPTPKGGRQTKKQAPFVPSPKGSSHATPTPDPPACTEQLPNPACPHLIATPTPPIPVQSVSQLSKSRRKARLTKLTTPSPDTSSVRVDDTTGIQDVESDEGSSGSEAEAEVTAPTSNHTIPMPAQTQNLTFPGPPINMLLAYLAQTGGPYIPARPPQSSSVSQPQGKPSKGIKAYPDGWRQVLNSAKDIVRSSILLKDPFPAPGQARITVNECFHEAVTTECRDGLTLEPGFTWSDSMMSILLNEIATCRGELKKLAKILVKSDPELFPPENNEGPPWDKTTSEIRTIAARLARQPANVQPLYDSNHVRTLVARRLTDLVFLNNPPTAAGDPLANPILKKLCQSFYEEEKWQRSLELQVNGDNEWMSTVTVVMVAFASTAYYNALEEWRSGHLVQKPFEAEKYLGTYNGIFAHITAHLSSEDLEAEQVADQFRTWAEESSFLQEQYDEATGDE
ncbi:hypothetical protein BJ322DRAFT_1110024 [Thelephora terrestris]|uniref:DUF6532 domain-containing protein n=1 Tax=Thelephora terrestris TaxID=56493 RepID=A0A9P6HBF3_9AGAM|nr:hypothetical protein BJ322DRAFT_1110024 [Thelephora terrestris]